MMRPKVGSRQRTAIKVDPLLMAFFDLPSIIDLPRHTNSQLCARGDRLTFLHDSPRRTYQEDGGIGSDNSTLLGQSISLTGDYFHDAVYNYPPGASGVSQGNDRLDTGPRSYNETMVPPRLFRVGTMFEGQNGVSMNQWPTKKTKSSAVQSLKQLIGYTGYTRPKLSSPSKKSLWSSPSFSEDETIMSHMNGNSLGTRIERFEESIPALQSKITMIRCNIQALERNLIATRNDLVRANEHLHAATLEVDHLQRAAVETEIGLSNLCLNKSRISNSFLEGDVTARSTCSLSSEHLYFLTPSSSLIDGDDSDICHTPRSTASFETLSSALGDSKVDVDATPLTKNLSKRNRSQYSDIPSLDVSTMASSETCDKLTHSDEVGGELIEDRMTFCKQELYIRTHDLGLAHKTGSDLLLLLNQHNVVSLIDALFEMGLQSAMDESNNWTPVRDTDKILNRRSINNSEIEGPMGKWENAASGSDIFAWSAPCTHDGHGSEYPLVKARGLIPTSALHVVKLLLDSDRVKQYNKMSLGRTDEYCFSRGVDNLDRCPATGIFGEAKIVHSKSQPPIIRKPIELRLLLHARRLHADDEIPKYILIGRSVWETAEGKAEASDASATRCEMLLSTNLVRQVESMDGAAWCEVTTITHAASPGGVPLSIGKRVGLAAAANYIRDIRTVFEKCTV